MSRTYHETTADLLLHARRTIAALLAERSNYLDNSPLWRQISAEIARIEAAIAVLEAK